MPHVHIVLSVSGFFQLKPVKSVVVGVCGAVLCGGCLIRSHLIEFTQRLEYIMYRPFTFGSQGQQVDVK